MKLTLHKMLEFTVETEKDRCLPFLDMLIQKNNGVLSSEWHTKQTDTGLTLNFMLWHR